jgi:hypothetical protein
MCLQAARIVKPSRIRNTPGPSNQENYSIGFCFHMFRVWCSLDLKVARPLVVMVCRIQLSHIHIVFDYQSTYLARNILGAAWFHDSARA